MTTTQSIDALRKQVSDIDNAIEGLQSQLPQAIAREVLRDHRNPSGISDTDTSYRITERGFVAMASAFTNLGEQARKAAVEELKVQRAEAKQRLLDATNAMLAEFKEV